MSTVLEPGRTRSRRTGPTGPETDAGAGSHRPRTPRRGAGDWARRAPLLPALVVTIVLTQLPFVATLVISFMDWNAYYPDERGFAGLDNFRRVFTDITMRESVVTTVVLTAAVVVASLVLGLAIALLLDRQFRGRGIVRTLMIAPFLVVPVAAALLWKHALYNPEYGLFNGLLTSVWSLFGSDDPRSRTGSPRRRWCRWSSRSSGSGRRS